jgi:hypothetical protein
VPDAAGDADRRRGPGEADALLLVTEWKEFRGFDLSTMRELLRQPLVLTAAICMTPRRGRRRSGAGIGRGAHTGIPARTVLIERVFLP